MGVDYSNLASADPVNINIRLMDCLHTYVCIFYSYQRLHTQTISTENPQKLY